MLKICCLVIDRPPRTMPDIDIDRSGCAVPAPVIASSMRGVQSLVTSVNYHTSKGPFLPREENKITCVMLMSSWEPYLPNTLWVESATPSLVHVDLRPHQLPINGPVFVWVIVLISFVVMWSCLGLIWHGKKKNRMIEGKN